MKAFLLALTYLFSLQAAEITTYRYNELMIKDYDEMLQAVNAKLRKARANEGSDQEAIEHLRDAMKLILSRPDSDNMVAKLVPEIRKELTGYNAFNDVLSGVAAEAIGKVKDEKAAAAVQATAIFELENLIALIKPESVNNNELRKILDRIRSADLRVPEGVRKDMKLRGMFKTHNPSETARAVLKSLPKLTPKNDEE